MILRKNQNAGGLLLKFGFRPAGTMQNDNGELVNWEDAYQLVILPFEEDKHLRKYNISPECVDEISAILEPIHWACLVDLEISNKLVVGVTIVEDCLANFYANN